MEQRILVNSVHATGHCSSEHRHFLRSRATDSLWNPPAVNKPQVSETAFPLSSCYFLFLPRLQWWGAVVAEVKVPSVESTELKVLPLKPGVGQI